MIGIIHAHRKQLRARDRRERLYPLQRCRFPVKGRSAKNIALKAELLAINDFGVKNLLTLLKPANCSHKICRALYQTPLSWCKPKAAKCRVANKTGKMR